MDEKLVAILIVDDDPGDVRLTLEALRRSKVHAHVSVVRDGIEALAFLRREGRHADVPRPDLVLLDLNMPRMNGRELLAEIKADPDLKEIPVLILTTSADEEDIQASYDLNANCYVTKPVDLKQFMTIVSSISDFWFTIVNLPSARTETHES